MGEEMETVYLDVLKLNDKEGAHRYLKEQFGFPDYYGANLDALYDCLTGLGDTEVILGHAGQEKGYGAAVMKVLKDAVGASGCLRFNIYANGHAYLSNDSPFSMK